MNGMLLLSTQGHIEPLKAHHLWRLDEPLVYQNSNFVPCVCVWGEGGGGYTLYMYVWSRLVKSILDIFPLSKWCMAGRNRGL